jgi:dihydrofolate reductase
MGMVPADMRRVRELTMGQAIIMGRKTFESIGRALPGRQNIVLSRRGMDVAGVEVVGSLAEGFERVEEGRDGFVFGGGVVYAEAMAGDEVEAIFVTEIDGDFRGDTFFPTIDGGRWREVERVQFPADSKNRYGYSFVKYQRGDV